MNVAKAMVGVIALAWLSPACVSKGDTVIHGDEGEQEETTSELSDAETEEPTSESDSDGAEVTDVDTDDELEERDTDTDPPTASDDSQEPGTETEPVQARTDAESEQEPEAVSDAGGMSPDDEVPMVEESCVVQVTDSFEDKVNVAVAWGGDQALAVWRAGADADLVLFGDPDAPVTGSVSSDTTIHSGIAATYSAGNEQFLLAWAEDDESEMGTQQVRFTWLGESLQGGPSQVGPVSAPWAYEWGPKLALVTVADYHFFVPSRVDQINGSPCAQNFWYAGVGDSAPVLASSALRDEGAPLYHCSERFVGAAAWEDGWSVIQGWTQSDGTDSLGVGSFDSVGGAVDYADVESESLSVTDFGATHVAAMDGGLLVATPGSDGVLLARVDAATGAVGPSHRVLNGTYSPLDVRIEDGAVTLLATNGLQLLVAEFDFGSGEENGRQQVTLAAGVAQGFLLGEAADAVAYTAEVDGGIHQVFWAPVVCDP